MAVKIFIVSDEKDFESAIGYGGDWSSYGELDAALAGAESGQYVHSVFVDTNEVIIGKNTLGKLV